MFHTKKKNNLETQTQDFNKLPTVSFPTALGFSSAPVLREILDDPRQVHLCVADAQVESVEIPKICSGNAQNDAAHLLDFKFNGSPG